MVRKVEGLPDTHKALARCKIGRGGVCLGSQHLRLGDRRIRCHPPPDNYQKFKVSLTSLRLFLKAGEMDQ